MHEATQRNMIDVVKQLIQCGGDPEIKNQQGFTCLHIAAREGYVELVKLFVSLNVNQDIRDLFGYTASYWALQKDHKDCAALMNPPLKVSKEEYYDYMKICWEKEGFKPGGKKKKGKGGKKKKK